MTGRRTPRPRRDLWAWYTRRLPTWLGLVLPLLLLPAPLVLLGLRGGGVWAAATVQATAVVSLEGALLLGLTVFRMDWWLALALVLYVELLYLVWLLRNVRVLRRWRRVARFLERREAAVVRLHRGRPWLRRSHRLGVTLVVLLPLNTGVLTGVLLGKATGLSDRATLGAVFLGILGWSIVLTAVVVFSLDRLVPWVRGLT
jgi:uncharacterized membrane protein